MTFQGVSIAPRRLELQLHLAGGVALDPLVRQRRPRDVAAQLLQPLAVVCLDPHRGVQTETVDVGAQRLAHPVLDQHAAAREHLVQVNAELGGRAEALDQRDRAVVAAVAAAQPQQAVCQDAAPESKPSLGRAGGIRVVSRSKRLEGVADSDWRRRRTRRRAAEGKGHPGIGIELAAMRAAGPRMRGWRRRMAPLACRRPHLRSVAT